MKYLFLFLILVLAYLLVFSRVIRGGCSGGGSPPGPDSGDGGGDDCEQGHTSNSGDPYCGPETPDTSRWCEDHYGLCYNKCVGGQCVLTMGIGSDECTENWQCQLCNNNGICDAGETQDNCPNDCKTTVTMQPNVDITPSQLVTIIVAFTDSRYAANHDVKLDLTIDGKNWSATDCWMNGVRWADMGWTGMTGGGWSCLDGACNGTYVGHSVKITSANGYGKIEAECKIPATATGGPHTVQATPTIY